MIVAAMVLGGLAALLHVYIWWLECFEWRGRALAVFGNSPTEADATAEMAFNQGFYNLFLTLGTAVGIVLVAADHPDAGRALVAMGTASMLGAALVLVGHNRTRARSALSQGLLPALTLVALMFS